MHLEIKLSNCDEQKMIYNRKKFEKYWYLLKYALVK